MITNEGSCSLNNFTLPIQDLKKKKQFYSSFNKELTEILHNTRIL